MNTFETCRDSYRDLNTTCLNGYAEQILQRKAKMMSQLKKQQVGRSQSFVESIWRRQSLDR